MKGALKGLLREKLELKTISKLNSSQKNDSTFYTTLIFHLTTLPIESNQAKMTFDLSEQALQSLCVHSLLCYGYVYNTWESQDSVC